jgi:hypothetical protein
MAIRTHGPEILSGIDLVVRSNAREWVEVMNVREPVHHFAIDSHEIETTEETCCPVMRDAGFPSAGIALVSVNHNSLHATFVVNRPTRNFLGKSSLLLLGRKRKSL